MAKANFERLTDWVLAHEGGYVNHPDDPGGATNYGVIQRTYDAYRRRKRLSPQSVRAITMDEVRDIYRDQYWDKVWGDHLPAGPNEKAGEKIERTRRDDAAKANHQGGQCPEEHHGL